MISKFLKFPFVLALMAILLVACNKDEITSPDNPPTTENTTNPTQIQNLVVADSAGCYDIVFPVTFLYEDGTTQTANSETDLWTIFESEPFPVNIEFPINLEDPVTGEMVTAANEEELDTYFEDCDFDDDDWDDDFEPCDSIDFDFGQLACYNFVFPVSFVLEDGTTVTAQSEDDLDTIFNENNAPEDFVYPITLEDVENGEMYTVNNEEELEQLLEACFDDDDDDEHIVYEVTFVSIADDSLANETCYSYVYPISILTEDEVTLTANSDEELLTIIFDNEPIDDFVYPFQVINNEDNATITVNDDEEAEDLVENCE